MGVIVTPPQPKAPPGCVRCGRGQFDVRSAPVSVPRKFAQEAHKATEMEKVVCTLFANHQTGDPHLEKCTGWVYQHKDARVCGAVQRQAKRT